MDWVGFLDTNGIDYVTSGKNTKRGNLSVQCPWCGAEDQSQHLSISLTEDAFGCWRNKSHAGRKPYSLVAALLGCSYPQARLIVQQFSAPDPANLEDAITALSGPQQPVQKAKPTSPPPTDFQKIKPVGLTSRFWRYLAGRGFDDAQSLIDRYGLLCCQSGLWRNRMVIPVFDQNRVIGYTARAIQASATAPRYLTSSEEVKDTIYNEQNLDGGKVLFITEGPFDALKMDFYGYKYDCHATAMFGVNPTAAQVSVLRATIKRFDKAIILFDAGAVEQAMALCDWLPPGVIVESLPEEVDDPGKLTKAQVKEICSLMGRHKNE